MGSLEYRPLQERRPEMITITVQTVYVDGKRQRNQYDIEVGDQAINNIDQETLDKLVEQLRKITSDL
jgi:hypothetical protein